MASIYYKTHKTSETGQKFDAVFAKHREVNGQIKEFLKLHDIVSYRKPTYMMAGPVDMVEFAAGVKPDTKVWRSGKHGWSPRKNTKEGKAMQAELNALPRMDAHELNMCVGFGGSPFRHIGVKTGDPTHVFFSIGADWQDITIPSDCEEITYSEYYGPKEAVPA